MRLRIFLIILTIGTSCQQTPTKSVSGLQPVTQDDQEAEFLLGVEVKGLASGESVIIHDSVGSDQDLTFKTNGEQDFSTLRKLASSYNISVLTQPKTQTCAVSSGTGTMIDSTTISVTCTNKLSATHPYCRLCWPVFNIHGAI